ncbi:uncharacterized protein SOCE836_055380 [Sorangium cellulosum]|uniref:Uncharacterized protein n=1 Tax=Sorangium cellulosum TaxID=56 RepID=A0A4P2QSW1_SORCE|nr:uncharacterized protein SOCE836_055380 [Sorangium cellulosum]WCQ92695.1 hypothetical protein NQZ70_05438 [Sorangium sp. Soce836]
MTPACCSFDFAHRDAARRTPLPRSALSRSALSRSAPLPAAQGLPPAAQRGAPAALYSPAILPCSGEDAVA